jgi:Cell division protein ZapA
MSELIPISAVIADRSYRIKISPTDEEVVRKTLKTINDKVVEFKTMFAGKDMQDYIAMVLIWYATEQTAGGITDIENENVANRLIAIEKLLDSQLNEK